MAAPMPVANLGGNPAVAKEIQSLLLPEYDYVHICTTPLTALTELPFLCAGVLDTPDAFGVGSNSSRPVAERKVPKVIVFGGCVTDEEIETVMQAVKTKVGEDAVKVVRVTMEDIRAAGAERPSAGVVARVIKGKLGALVEEGVL